MRENMYVSLKIGEYSKQIFLIQYTKEGGFFIKDLIRIGKEDKNCLIFKAATDVLNHGKRTAAFKYSAFTSGEAKLTHHYDGRAHISGDGVESGYHDNGEPKGAALKSFPLNLNNDGGPVFSFLTWGCEFACRDAQERDFLLIPKDEYIHTADQHEDLNAYVVKGFYLLKEWFNPEDLILETVIYESPVEGSVELRIIPSPQNTPGVLGLLATKANHGFKDKFGFTLSGAPGSIYDKKYCDALCMVYPYQDTSGEHVNLNRISEIK